MIQYKNFTMFDFYKSKRYIYDLKIQFDSIKEI